MGLYNLNNYINTEMDMAFLRLRYAIFQRAIEDLKFLHYPEKHKDFRNGQDAYIFLSNKNKWYETLFFDIPTFNLDELVERCEYYESKKGIKEDEEFL